MGQELMGELMDHKTRQELLDQQREIVKNSTCTHLIACATTPQLRENAIELIRSGNAHEAAIGMAMLTGPCLKVA